MSEPREGWYAVLWGGRFATVIQRRENGWHDPYRNECSEKWPYIEWTLGPRIDDLLRDAAALDWLLGLSSGQIAKLFSHGAAAKEYRRVLIDAETAKEHRE